MPVARHLRELAQFSIAALTALFISLAGVAILQNGDAEGGTASNLTTLILEEDRFWNYDFQSQNVASNNVDWPLTIGFWNNATINKVKSVINDSYPFSGGPMYARLKDGPSNFVWDTDSGLKGEICPVDDTPHIRLYADSDDRIYNVGWGYYVLATTHFDFAECTPCPEFGWTEEAEGLFASYMAGKGYSTTQDWSSFYNYEAPHWEFRGGCTWNWWDNNGQHSIIHIP